MKEGKEREVKYYCACSKCYKVYQYKDPSGKNFGTKNMIDHMKRCNGLRFASASLQNQLQLSQTMKQKPQFSSSELATMKGRMVEYCVNVYNSSKAVENTGLNNLMQSCIDVI